MPLLGLIADNHGPRGAFVVLAAIPLLAIYRRRLVASLSQES